MLGIFRTFSKISGIRCLSLSTTVNGFAFLVLVQVAGKTGYAEYFPMKIVGLNVKGSSERL